MTKYRALPGWRTAAALAVAICACLLLLPAGASAKQKAAPKPAPKPAETAPIAEEGLDGASAYRTKAQQQLRDLVAAGETDIDKLVSVIATDTRESLDHIVVNLATQTIYECNIEGRVLKQSRISSGRRGYDTPPGPYNVVNKSPKAYSQKYSAWMLNWMGLTSDGGYGMHGLEGSSYERLLGGVASHGCIRLSRAYAKDLYTRVKVGMPVQIVKRSQAEARNLRPGQPPGRRLARARYAQPRRPLGSLLLTSWYNLLHFIPRRALE